MFDEQLAVDSPRKNFNILIEALSGNPSDEIFSEIVFKIGSIVSEIFRTVINFNLVFIFHKVETHGPEQFSSNEAFVSKVIEGSISSFTLFKH